MSVCKADMRHWLCTGCLLHDLELTLFFQAVAWCPWQSNVLATGGGTSDRHIRIWNVCSGTCLSAVDAHSQVRHEHQLGNKHLLAGHLYRAAGCEAQRHGKGVDHAHLWVVSISTSKQLVSSLSYLCYCLFPGLFYPVVNKLQGIHFGPWLCTESAGYMEVSNDGQGH